MDGAFGTHPHESLNLAEWMLLSVLFLYPFFIVPELIRVLPSGIPVLGTRQHRTEFTNGP